MADEEGKAEEEGKEEGKAEDGKAEEGKEEPKDAVKEAAKEQDKKEAPKSKEDAKEKVSAAGGATNKAVKTKKNQFAMNRLLLMLMDVRPEALCTETINDLKKVYALLVNIHRNYKS